MDKKINITVNGKNFEAVVDESLLTGLFGMDQVPNKVNVPVPMSLPKEISHEELENNPLWLEEVTKVNQAIMILHERLNRLEDKVLFKLAHERPRRMIMHSLDMPKLPLIDSKVMGDIMNTLVTNLKSAKPKVEKKQVTKKQKKPVTKKK